MEIGITYILRILAGNWAFLGVLDRTVISVMLRSLGRAWVFRRLLCLLGLDMGHFLDGNVCDQEGRGLRWWGNGLRVAVFYFFFFFGVSCRGVLMGCYELMGGVMLLL